jgi:hypothetical protein
MNKSIPELRKSAEDIVTRRLAPAIIADKAASTLEQYSNSADLPIELEKIFGPVEMINLPRYLSGITSKLSLQIVQILNSTQNISDKSQKDFANKQTQKKIDALLKKYEDKILTMLQRSHEGKVERLNEEAKFLQLDRMYASSLASSERDSEEKLNAISEVDDSFLIKPDDPLTISILA